MKKAYQLGTLKDGHFGPEERVRQREGGRERERREREGEREEGGREREDELR